MFFQSKKKHLQKLWRARIKPPPIKDPPQPSPSLHTTTTGQQQPQAPMPSTDGYSTYCSSFRIAAAPVAKSAICSSSNDDDGGDGDQQQWPMQQRRSSRNKGRGTVSIGGCPFEMTATIMTGDEEKSRKNSTILDVIGHCCRTTVPAASEPMDVDDQWSQRERARYEKLTEALGFRQLDTLLRIVDDYQSAGTASDPKTVSARKECVLVPRHPELIYGEEPQVIACRLWRWPDLDSAADLKQMPACCCPTVFDPVYVCCNPCHWSRKTTVPQRQYQGQAECGLTEDCPANLSTSSDVPPPPYSLVEQRNMDPHLNGQDYDQQSTTTTSTISRRSHHKYSQQQQQHIIGHLSSSECDNKANLPYRQQRFSTDDITEDDTERASWCKVAYWEQCARIGAQQLITQATVHIVSRPQFENEICLTALVEAHCNSVTMDRAFVRNPKDMVNVGKWQATRDKIGAGITLSRERDGIWIYNSSSAPVFIHSPTIAADQLPSNRYNSTIVIKLKPGHCLLAYNTLRTNPMTCSSVSRSGLGPIDYNTVYVSFVKGWGTNYTRSDITRCPCWLQIMLNQHR